VLFLHNKNSNEFIYCNKKCIKIVHKQLNSEQNSEENILETLIGSLKSVTTIFFEIDLSMQVLTIGIDLSI
jgi:hypothetical protein